MTMVEGDAQTAAQSRPHVMAALVAGTYCRVRVAIAQPQGNHEALLHKSWHKARPQVELVLYLLPKSLHCSWLLAFRITFSISTVAGGARTTNHQERVLRHISNQ